MDVACVSARAGFAICGGGPACPPTPASRYVGADLRVRPHGCESMPIVFKGRVFSVEVETVRLPNGREHEIAIVRHPPAVVLIPIEAANRVILVRQYRHSVRR